VRKINKGNEPSSLTSFKRSHPQMRYKDLTDTVRQEIRAACTREQYFLCAYCCQEISGENVDTMNEHVEAQSLAPNRTLDFHNIVASCRSAKQCDASHGSQALPLTPMMKECETELRFKLSGRVEGLTQRAKDAIDVLRLGDTELNNKFLIERRKQLVEALIWTSYGKSGVELELEQDVTVLRLMVDLLAEPQNGRLESFAPVLTNLLKTYIAML
jgi:uncharacterized protein (TIGR02646 family)